MQKEMVAVGMQYTSLPKIMYGAADTAQHSLACTYKASVVLEK